MNELVALDIAEQADAVEATLRQSADAIAQARDLLAASTSVRFVALGSSRHAAGYGSEVIGAALGMPAVVAPAPGWGTSDVAWTEGEMAVAVTQSGRTPALLEKVRSALADGVPVIAVINADDSPLHELADVVVALHAGAERVVAATKSVTAQHVALRALAGELDPALARAAVEAALTADIARAVRGECPSAVVCGGVAGEWIAGEVALKFSEMLGRFVAGEPLVEFLHGPVAAGGAVLVMADEDDPNLEPLLGRDDVVIGTPTGIDFVVPAVQDPTIAAIARLVVGQRIVLAWAIHLGIDADEPRGLSKVTASR